MLFLTRHVDGDVIFMPVIQVRKWELGELSDALKFSQLLSGRAGMRIHPLTPEPHS